MFKWHVFRGVKPILMAYIFAYGCNYLVGLVFISISHRFISSPYLAGLTSLFAVSLFSYFVLKRFVFRARPLEP
jgi:hypothetical protein